VRENSRVKTPAYLIITENDYPMLISFNEVVIEEDLELLVKELPIAVCEESITRGFVTGMLGSEVLEFICQLEDVTLKKVG